MINETNVKYSMRKQLSSVWTVAIYLKEPHKICRRVAISALLVNVRGSLLLAVAVSLHYIPKCLRSTLTRRKTATTIIRSEPLCRHVIVTQQRPIAKQFAPEFRNLHLQQRSRLSELQFHDCIMPEQWTDCCGVWVAYQQNKLSLQKLTQLIGIKLLILHFLEISSS